MLWLTNLLRFWIVYQSQDFTVLPVMMVDVSGAVPAAAEGVYGGSHPADHPPHHQEVSRLNLIVYRQLINIVST